MRRPLSVVPQASAYSLRPFCWRGRSAGLITIILGILAFEVKRTQWEQDPGPELMYIWYQWSRTGMVAAGLLLLNAVIHCYKPYDLNASASASIENSADQLLELAGPTCIESAKSDGAVPPSTGA